MYKRQGPGTSFDKLGGYSYGAVVAVQAVRDGWGQTDRGWVSMDYLRPVEAAEEGLVTDTGLRVLQDILPAEADNRPGGSNPDTYITIQDVYKRQVQTYGCVDGECSSNGIPHRQTRQCGCRLSGSIHL